MEIRVHHEGGILFLTDVQVPLVLYIQNTREVARLGTLCVSTR